MEPGGNEAAESGPGMDTTTAMQVLAHTSSPIEVGEIEFDEHGGARPRLSDAPVAFRFRYYGLIFDATMPMADDGRLYLTATLGVIPFSLENSFGRKAARAIIRRAHMPNGRLCVDSQSRVHLEMTGTPEKPRTPVNVLATVAGLLMEAKPYLELLEVALSRGRRRSRRPIA
jgi:hypothetical protein